MKTLAMTILIVLTASFAMAGDRENANYVTVDGKTYFCSDVHIGFGKTKAIMENGEKLVFPMEKVDAYMRDGRLFEKKTLYCEKNKPMGTAFMEVIAVRSGLKLYKYCRYSERFDPLNGICEKAEAKYCFFVYRDGEFYLRVDEKNAETALPFFGIDVKS